MQRRKDKHYVQDLVKRDLEATWRRADNTPRVDVPRLKKQSKAVGSVQNRPRVRIAYRRGKKGNIHASKTNTIPTTK